MVEVKKKHACNCLALQSRVDGRVVLVLYMPYTTTMYQYCRIIAIIPFIIIMFSM